MKIHSIIFIAQLKSVTKKSNSYERKINIESSSVKKKKNNLTFHYEIERLLNKKMSREQFQYFVKWIDYESKHNVWYSLNALNNAKKLIVEYEIKITDAKSSIKKKRIDRNKNKLKSRSRNKNRLKRAKQNR